MKVIKYFFILLMTVICTSLAFLEYGGVNYVLNPFLKGIFEEYVPTLKFKKIEYSLLEHNKVALADVSYEVEGIKIKAQKVKLEVINLESLLNSINPESDDIFRDLVFNVEGNLSNLDIAGIKFNNFLLNISKPNGQKLYFKNLKSKKIRKDTKLSMFVDVKKEIFELNARSVSLTNILNLINQEFSGTGLINGKGFISWKNNLVGDFNLESSNFYIKGIQIDKILETFSKPSKTNAADIATYVALGPVGLLASSTTQLGGSLIFMKGGESYLEKIKVHLKLDGKEISFHDVAFSTKENRASLEGALLLPELSFRNATFYTLDTNNCALLKQDIAGTLIEPDFRATVTFINSLVSPFVSLVKKFSPLSCEKVYNGEVAAPKKKKKSWR